MARTYVRGSLSIFPKDYKIQRDGLIWRWIAEGFIYSANEKLAQFELGEIYFNELVNRSMIQPVGIYGESIAKSYCAHNMMH